MARRTRKSAILTFHRVTSGQLAQFALPPFFAFASKMSIRRNRRVPTLSVILTGIRLAWSPLRVALFAECSVWTLAPKIAHQIDAFSAIPAGILGRLALVNVNLTKLALVSRLAFANAFSNVVARNAPVETLDIFAFVNRVATVFARCPVRTEAFVAANQIDALRAIEAGIWFAFIYRNVAQVAFPPRRASAHKLVRIVAARRPIATGIRFAFVNVNRTVSPRIP